jgi:hypothetical protein
VRIWAIETVERVPELTLNAGIAADLRGACRTIFDMGYYRSQSLAITVRHKFLRSGVASS